MEKTSKEEQGIVLVENDILPQMEKEISVLENIVKESLLSIHEDMNGLILKANNTKVAINDKDAYDTAIELKREIKNTHIALKKKKEDFKKPVIAYGKRIESFTKEIYEPLVSAEKLLVSKIAPYTDNQQKLKDAELLKKEQEEAKHKAVEDKLFELNSTLAKVNQCKIKSEVDAVEDYLNNTKLTDFGDRSDEAGFIINNLLMTCRMYKNSLPETLEVEKPIEVKTPIQSKELGSSSITSIKNISKIDNQTIEEENTEKTSVPTAKIEGSSDNSIENTSKIDNQTINESVSEKESPATEESDAIQMPFDLDEKPISKKEVSVEVKDEVVEVKESNTSEIKQVVFGNSDEIDLFGSLNQQSDDLESSVQKDNVSENINETKTVSLENDGYLVELLFNEDGSEMPHTISLVSKKTSEIVHYKIK